MDHTKEPWAIEDTDSGLVLEGHGKGPMDEEFICLLESISKADARRIVACVNACAGIETEKLEEEAKDPIAGIFGRMAAKAHAKQREMESELFSLRSALVEKTARVERLRQALVRIFDYSYDNDGEHTAERLKCLVKELSEIAREALAATADTHKEHPNVRP